GITSQPDETWMMQVARNLTAAGDGFLRGMSHIILDRDPLYTAAFRRLLRDSGVTPLVLPAWSPNLKRVCRKDCRIREVRVLGPNGGARRPASADRCPRTRPPLSSRTAAPRLGQRIHRATENGRRRGRGELP